MLCAKVLALSLALQGAAPRLAPPARATTRLAARGTAPAATAVPARPAAVSAKQATALARRIEAGMARADVTPILEAWDLPAFQNRILAGDPISPKGRRDMLAGIRDSMKLETLVEQAKKATTSYRFLRVRGVEGETRALFRLVSDEGDNYHDWVLAPGQLGPVIVDMDNYATGEPLSQMMRRSMLAAAGVTGPDGRQRIQFAEGRQGAAQVQRLEALKRLATAAQAKDIAAVEEAYNVLPPALRTDRTVISLRLQGLQGDTAAYLRVLEEAVKQHGDGIVGPFNLFRPVLHQQTAR